MTRIVHVVQQLSLGGASRSHLAVAKYSAKNGNFQHAVASLLAPQPEAVELARASGVEVLPSMQRDELSAELARADIVHVGWWNTPELDEWLRSPLPAMRMCVWFHVAGDRPAQIITPELVGMADVAMAACPHSLRVDAIRNLSDEDRHRRCALVYDAADFARLGEFEPRPHQGFVVGYAGTLNFQKLHPDYVRMSAGVRVPGVRFVVCGAGGEELLRRQAEEFGVTERFDFRGYVADIGSALSEFDVFGYPLCENTYAAGELVLQEAMYAGIPAVVFPYGGVGDLVIPSFTGLVVTSELEYREAVEHLYRVPEERARLGRNAREYASQLLGAENAATTLNREYERLLERPKRSRSWSRVVAAGPIDDADWLADLTRCAAASGAARFVEGLGDFGTPFAASRTTSADASHFPADEEIARADDLLWEGAGGIRSYRNHYPKDPWLPFWNGLVLRERGRFAEAVLEFRAAQELGFSHWRLLWYLAQSAHEAGHWQIAGRVLRELRERAPGLPEPPGSIERLESALQERRSSIERFREQMEKCDLASAAATLAEAVHEFPNSPDVQNAWAEYELQTGDREKAVELLEKLAAANPDHAEILNNLAVIRWQDGDRGGALTLLHEATKADPEEPSVKANLAELTAEMT